MSKISDRISYLQGLADGMKLDPDENTNRLILGILDILSDVSDELDGISAAHTELSDYVDSIDEDLANLEAELYDDEDDDIYDAGDEEEYDEDDGEEISEGDVLLYECPHCGTQVEIDAGDVEFDENTKCPACGKELFPELPEE